MTAKIETLFFLDYIFFSLIARIAEGTIDIIWEPSAYRLVINIPKEGKKAMFYADNYKDQISEGVFHLDNFNVSLIPFAVFESL